MRQDAEARFIVGAMVILLAIVPGIAFGSEAGVVVASVEEGEAAEAAGLTPGDVLQRWRLVEQDRETAGKLDSPWTLVEVEEEHAGGMAVVLEGERDGVPRSFTIMPPLQWGLTADFLPVANQAGNLLEVLELLDAGEAEAGIDALRELAGSADAARAAWYRYRAGNVLNTAGEADLSATVLEEGLEDAARAGHDDVVLLRLAGFLVRSGAPDRAVDFAESALDKRTQAGAPELTLARTHMAVANTRLKLFQPDAAEPDFEKAYEICARLAPEGMVMAQAHTGLGGVALLRGQVNEAESHYTSAWELVQVLSPGSRFAASLAHNLGLIEVNRGRMEAAEEWFQRALVIRVAAVPESVEHAETLIALGVVAYRRGQTEPTETYAKHAAEICENVAPESLPAAFAYELLGAASWNRGDLSRAEQSFRAALEIREKMDPGNLVSANSYNNLGAVAQTRGDHAQAEMYHRRALEIRQQHAPGSLDVALSLHNLGTLMWKREDLEAAESYFLQAIAIREEQAPDSVYVAESYANLGGVYRDRGDTKKAEQLLLKALQCWRTAGPDSLDEAMALGNLANWKIEDGDLEGADEMIARSLSIREEIAPGGVANAMILQSMGMLAQKRGQIEQAEIYYRKSISMFENNGVRGAALAETRHLLGRMMRKAGRNEDALREYLAAVEDVESILGRLGGTEKNQSDFRAKHHAMYQELIEILVELGRDEQAFGFLERSRARGFLSLLEQRELLFSVDISEEFDRERRLARAEVERLATQLGETSAKEEDQKTELFEALQAARIQMREVEDRIREQAPRLAALTAPEPLDLEGSRGALDAGTVALSYSVGKKLSLLFIVGPEAEDFRVVTLPVDEAGLRHKIRRIRNAVANPYSAPSTVERLADGLGETLLEPAKDEITRSRRVLLIPDGPLHLMPFSVLPEPGGDELLIAARPVHRASSVTVFAEIASQRRHTSAWRVAAFGDPRYDGLGEESGTRSTLLAAFTSGEGLYQLPWTRDEVNGLGRLFPESAEVWIGADASEERARAINRDTDVLHFACHGLMNESRPLESALALSVPEDTGHDGLLQAWEVFESLRVDAHVVVLSACRTALGRELAGEGIVGLTRAFQFAGARSVVASLWSVDDRSTAALMDRFYQGLAAGSNVDEALRAAQLELASGPFRSTNDDTIDATHPYYWAAFELNGDWQ